MEPKQNSSGKKASSYQILILKILNSPWGYGITMVSSNLKPRNLFCVCYVSFPHPPQKKPHKTKHIPKQNTKQKAHQYKLIAVLNLCGNIECDNHTRKG